MSEEADADTGVCEELLPVEVKRRLHRFAHRADYFITALVPWMRQPQANSLPPKRATVSRSVTQLFNRTLLPL